MFVLGYVPLLNDREQILPDHQFKPMQHYIESAHEEYAIKSIRWVQYRDAVSPVLEIPHADEIIKHMDRWSGGKVGQWFRVLWYREGATGYKMLLESNVKKSFNRAVSMLKPKQERPDRLVSHWFNFSVEASSIFKPEFVEKPAINIGLFDGKKEDASFIKLPVVRNEGF